MAPPVCSSCGVCARRRGAAQGDMATRRHVVACGPTAAGKSRLMNNQHRTLDQKVEPAFKESDAVSFDGTEDVECSEAGGFCLYDVPGIDSDKVNSFHSSLLQQLKLHNASSAIMLLVLPAGFVRFARWIGDLETLFSKFFERDHRNVIIVHRDITKAREREVVQCLHKRGISVKRFIAFDEVNPHSFTAEEESRLITDAELTPVKAKAPQPTLAQSKVTQSTPATSNATKNRGAVIPPLYFNKNCWKWQTSAASPHGTVMKEVVAKICELMAKDRDRYQVECFMGDVILGIHCAVHVRGVREGHDITQMSCEEMQKCYVSKTQDGNEQKPGPSVILYERHVESILRNASQTMQGFDLPTSHHGKADLFEAIISITGPAQSKGWTTLHKLLIRGIYSEGNKILKQKIERLGRKMLK